VTASANSGSPRRLTARTFVLGQFLVVVAFLALWILFDKFLGGDSDLAFAVFGMPLLVVSTLTVVIWGLWGLQLRKLVLLALAVVADVGLVMGTPAIDRAGERLFFESRRSRLESLARDITAYGRIHQMSDGTRHFKELNGELVAYTPAEVDTSEKAGASPTRPLAQVLERDAIAAQRYDEFRRRLQDVKLIQFDSRPGLVAFLYDGMVDNLQGYLLVQPGGAPPPIRSELFGAQLVRLEPLGGGWYRFATT
jgi:hypothetical protein